jgi:hypothetical protein
MRTLLLGVAVLLGWSGGLCLAQESPNAIIERAIAAHGGQQRLARVRADRVRLSGTLHVGASAVPFSNETTVQLPDHFKSVVRLTLGERTQVVVHLLDGERAAILVDGQAQPVSSSHLAQLRQTLQLDHALRLVPLLTDPAFSLSLLGDTEINERPAVGVRVLGHGQRDVRLFFDRQTGLLVKTEQLLDGAGGKDVRHEAYYSKYRDVGGYLRAGKVVAYRDGRKVMEAELLSAQPLEQIDPGEFSRP